eukprot:CAMPEP_0181206942 /NCGR_PEP_ID=MMETSP1096-20121128/21306_1 /TAXON_ID=156174 ORGANISM="Chrysochromulina ericina, Strain CCMP281" /NCGR_SAMPLE_ID=MMETSP1096 /ASSEMBLY_ACC=CAM_ASM_000453 /LENGTH=63 /DNA_ID=CAMNT_0023297879 /DNA_START=221 /DNA_END=412 /DNA_ORIENTATION=-
MNSDVRCRHAAVPQDTGLDPRIVAWVSTVYDTGGAKRWNPIPVPRGRLALGRNAAVIAGYSYT